MFEHFSLADVKAAPLSIMVYLSMNGNRAVSVSDLAAETGFTEKPIRKGLATLQELGVVVSPRKNRYQLTGREYQLPLSWDERILPSGDSPRLTGIIPEKAGDFTELNRRVSLLEKAVFGYQDQVPGDSPEMQGDYPLWDSETDEDPEVEVLPREEWSGNIPGKMGVFPIDQRNKDQGAGSKVSVIKGNWSAAGDSPEGVGVIPENTGDIPEVLINNINNNPEKEVSKYVGRSTYLPENKSIEGTELTGEVESAARVTVPCADCAAAGEQSPCAPEAVTRWKAAKEQLKGLMYRGMYATVLKKAELIGYESGHYTVAVENAFTKDWADARLLIQAEKILGMLEGGVVSVSFVVDQSTQITVASEEADKYPAPSLELLPMPEDPKAAELTEICNDYLLDPAGIEYSNDQMRELTKMFPDPDVLRYILPRATMFENAKKWCEMDIRKAKKTLLKKYGIIGAAQAELSNNDLVTLELISKVCDELCPENKGLAVYRIKELAKE